MNNINLKHKIISSVVAGIAGVSIAFSAVPIPTADAGLLDAVLGVGLQYAAMDQQLNYLDGDGRNQLYESIKGQYGVNNDPELNAQLNRIMGNLSQGIAQVDPSINDKPYNYFINNDQTFNAFCTLGHNISVNTGLFNLVKNEDEVAVVIAHEMGHGQKKHVIKGYHNQVAVTLGSAVLANATGGLAGAVLGTVVNNQLSAKAITKPQEWEADNLAFDYIVKTPYNPGACAAIWQRVGERMATMGTENFVGEIFSPSDHPTHDQRRDNYSKRMTELSDGKVTVADGTITINGKNFLVCAPEDENEISAFERAYLIAGNLARVYENTNPEKVKKEQERIRKKKAEENQEDGEYKPRKFSLSGTEDKKEEGPVLKELPQKAYTEDGSLFVDGRYILTENNGEPTAEELAEVFNLIK